MLEISPGLKRGATYEGSRRLCGWLLIKVEFFLFC